MYVYKDRLLLCLFIFIAFTRYGASQGFEPGTSYFDSTGFVEFIAGNVPVVISAPHGGYLTPNNIPNCPNCSTVRDAYTQEIGRGLSEAYFEKTGCYPYVVINLLHRRKLDANRSINEATGGFPILEDAWHAYHGFIGSAKAQIAQDYGKGLFLDIHGHGHDIQRIEMGYLISKSELQTTDDNINSSDLVNESSIRALTLDNAQSMTHAELLRGEFSFGTIMNDKGFPSVPSRSDRSPENDEAYFSGGYNTRAHGSRNGEAIDAIQLELNQSIRFDEDIRDELIDSLVSSVIEFIDHHYIPGFSDSQCDVLSNTINIDSRAEILVYPNPSTGLINIKGLDKFTDIAIVDFYGREVFREKWAGQSIDISNLKNGNYVIVIRNENTVNTIKMVLMK